MPTRAVIVDAVRSPMGRGKPTGALAGLHPADLLAQVLSALVDRSSLDPALVDDVLIGCVGGAGEQSATPGRQALLAAGWPTSVPSVTIERKCGSGQQAVEVAAAGIVAGLYDIAVAGGVESMSRVPLGSARMGADPFGAGVRERFPVLIPQGVSAELVAQRVESQPRGAGRVRRAVARAGGGDSRRRRVQGRDRPYHGVVGRRSHRGG